MRAADLSEILASSLGREKAEGLVRDAVRALGLPGESALDPAQCKRVLDEIGKEGGLVSAAAKIAAMRLSTMAPSP